MSDTGNQARRYMNEELKDKISRIAVGIEEMRGYL